MKNIPNKYTGMIWDLAQILGASKWEWLQQNSYVHIYTPDGTIAYHVEQEANYEQGKPWVFCLLLPAIEHGLAADYRRARGVLQSKGIDAVADIRKLRGG